MSDAAVAFARAIGYVSAGTAEFMLDGRDFWFLELNGRIQVEHPVTELVTGIDLVREQLSVASGGRLRVGTTRAGHAVEARLYAEDRARSCPRPGRSSGCGCRTAFASTRVSRPATRWASYDPMIAKLIAHGPTREEALSRLADALAETEVSGVTTNLPFLRWLVAHPVVRAARRRPPS